MLRALVLVVVVALGGVLTACGSGGGEPRDFAEFAVQIARAAEAGDVTFFRERVQGEPRTCTKEDVEAGQDLPPPLRPLCQEEGQTFEQVYIAIYGAAGQVTSKERLIEDLTSFFEQALTEEQDAYGPGSVRLYALAVPTNQPDPERPVQTAILTAIVEDRGLRGRFVRAIDFRYEDGRWVIPGETAASFPIAVELLEPSSARVLYDGWTLYQ